MDHPGKPLSRQVDLNLLELFDVVYKTRNLTVAGHRLGLSQSAVSYGLARLRDMYGDALFVRMQRGVQPTPFADGLVEPVGAALSIVRGTLQRTPFVPGEARRSFRLAMSDIGERIFLPRLSRWLTEHAPGIAIETLSPDLPRLLEGLGSGEIDLAIGFLPGLGKRVHQQTLMDEHFVYIMRHDHPEYASRLSLSRIRRLRHALADPPGANHAAAVEKSLRAAGVRAGIALRVGSFLSLGSIVAATDLVAPVPSNLAATVAGHLGLRICTPAIRFPGFEVCMHWHPRFHRDPANVWLRGLLAELFRPS
ncbi:MAG: LysR family transcriptional regulator [Pseudoxanthomonas sp.]